MKIFKLIQHAFLEETLLPLSCFIPLTSFVFCIPIPQGSWGFPNMVLCHMHNADIKCNRQ